MGEEGVPQGTYPPARSRWGRGTPRYLPPRPSPSGGGGTPRYLHPPAKVPTPQPGPDGGRGRGPDGGYSKVPTPSARSWWGEGVPQGTNRPHQGTYPSWIGQQMETLLRRSRYASCVHAGGLSCLIRVYPDLHFNFFIKWSRIGLVSIVEEMLAFWYEQDFTRSTEPTFFEFIFLFIHCT